MTSRSETAARPHSTRLPRNVILLGVVSFFQDVSGEMVYPFIPIFLTTVLGAPVAAVGLIEGVAESTASLMKLVSGWWSDRVQRRMPLLIGGYGLAAVGKILLAVATVWPLVLLARFVDRFGKGVRGSPRDALIADSTSLEVRGRAFGLHRSMDTAGAVVGPLLALLLAALLHDRLRPVFLVAVIPGIVGVLALLLVREPPRSRPATPAVRDPAVRAAAGPMPRPLLLFMIASVVFALGNSSDVFLLLRARNLGLSTTFAVLAYVVYNFVYMAGAYPAGILSDHVGRRGVFVIGLLIFAVSYAGFAFVHSSSLVWPLFALYGCYMASTEGVSRALIADFAPSDRRASAIGLYGMLTGLAGLAASVVAGLLWDHIGVPAPFILGAASALIALLFLLVANPNPRSAPVRTT